MRRKKLPIGIQTFRHIREDDAYYYVDKTALAYQLADAGKYYFLSRPRRFGKSLFLDTLAELFAGNEPLFRGLYVHDKWDWGKRHPVIRLSFAEGRLESRDELDRRIRALLTHNAAALGVEPLDTTDIPEAFIQLIQRAVQGHGQRAVVLVDEYDKPILDNLTEPDIARAMREGLRNLYSVIKGQDAYLRFAFLTGVSKFSKVSIFSGLNNLNDITVDAEYATICGYTDDDIDTVFAPELEGLDREQIRQWYNGYNWLGPSVYNPFDVMLLFAKREFRPYWFETGTPTFLVQWLRQQHYFAPKLEATVAAETLLSAFDVDGIEPEAMLWQTGYLSIRRSIASPKGALYELSLPNHEVRVALTDALLKTYVPARPLGRTFDELDPYPLLVAGDVETLHQRLRAIYAAIPHDWYRNNRIAEFEGYWASVFYAYLASCGAALIAEDVTNLGQIDLTVQVPGRTYLFEFKVVRSDADRGQALVQLQAKGYADKYRAEGKPIHLVGIEFGRRARNVVGFETLHLDTSVNPNGAQGKP